MLPRLALPPSRTALALIALAFVVPGLVGHDPWRAFDVLAIEVAHQMHLSGDWLVPRVAGEPWLEDPPFFHWLALGFAKLLGGVLGFHNAVRLASGLAVLAGIVFLFLAGNAVAAKDDGTTAASAALLLVGSVGLIVHAHEAVPDLATLAASCAALMFLFLWNEKPVRRGIAFGVSLGLAFLSTGPVMPAVLATAAVLAHAVCDEWRNARALRFLGAAAVALALVAAAWPLALALRSPELAQGWWSGATTPRGEFAENLRYYVATAGWATWPAWPLAAFTALAQRREWRSPRLFVPLAAALAALPAIAWAGPQQDINTLALIAPLALLGAQGVQRLRRGAANALDWFGVMTFAFFAGLVWLGYVAMLTGVPPRIARNFLKTAPGYAPQFEPLPFAAALVLTLVWLYLVFHTAPSPTRGVLRWAAGVALLWGCFATLWLPWADHLKSYRSVALQLKSVIPAGTPCIAESSLGVPQRAALSYHAAIRTEPQRIAPRPKCPLLIVQGSPRFEAAPGPGWRKLADVGRPGDRGERYRVYRFGPG